MTIREEAEIFVRSDRCCVMDTHTDHEDSFLAGSQCEAVLALVEALEFYANRRKINSVCNGTGYDYDEDEKGFISAGKRARKALEAWRKANE